MSAQLPSPSLRKRLKDGTPFIGSWLQGGSLASAEILAQAGFSWLGLDCEHTSADIKDVEAVSRALGASQTPLLVRVSQADSLEIRQCLDVGAQGVIVPLVEDAEVAEQVVAAAKYPPKGKRGFCFGRMNEWGKSFFPYLDQADEAAVIVMIESRKGVENIDAILATPGIDGVFIGPYDLSGSYDVTGEINHPLVLDARKRILEACKRSKVVPGLHLIHPSEEQANESLEEGFTFICVDADIILLRKAADLALSLFQQN